MKASPVGANVSGGNDGQAGYAHAVLYERTQSSPLWLLAGIPLFTAVGVAGMVADGDYGIVLIAAAIGAAVVGMVAIFSRLTVSVHADRVEVAFGMGWPSRTISLSDVLAVEQVRADWFWRWGIRAIRGGWMWNAWGLDAVELRLASGKRFRIGTDDPRGLCAALVGVVGR